MPSEGLRVLLIADPNSIHDIKKVANLVQMGAFFHVVPVEYPGKIFPSSWPGLDEDHVVLHPPRARFSVVRFWRTLESAFYFRRLIRQHDLRSFLVLFVEPSALWAILGRWWKVKTLLFAYGTDVLITIPKHFQRRDPLNLFVQWLYRKAFASADYILATSEQQLLSIRRILRGRYKGGHLVRTGVDVDYLETLQLSARRGEIEDRPYLLFPRKMEPLYNHEFCLAGIARLPEHLRKTHRFIFLGSDTAQRDYYDHFLKLMAEVPADIVVLESQEPSAMASLYARSAGVVMTPRSDGSPVSAMEAMFFKKPLILGPLGYDQDLFAKPVTVLSSWNPEELASALRAALETPPAESELEECRDRVYRLCDIRKEMSRLKIFLLPT